MKLLAKTVFAALSGILCLCVILSVAHAGPIAERIKERREERLGKAGSDRSSLPVGAVAQRDIQYGASAAQSLDVYASRKAKNQPVIFMVHGGGWTMGDKAHGAVVKNKAAHYLGLGYVFISVNYRLVPEADPREQAADIARAIAFVQSKAKEWGGDPDRVILMGHSAGAHLVSLVNADPDLGKEAGASASLGVVSLDSGAYDVEAVMKGRHAPLFDEAFGKDPALWRSASPSAQLRGDPKPMLLVCSSRRRESCDQAKTFKAKLEKLGARASVLAEDLSHREINESLGLKSAYTSSVDDFIDGLLTAR